MTPDDFELQKSTHPPYSVRRRVIIAAFKSLGWDKPVCSPEDGPIFDAEKSLIEYIVADEASPWASILDGSQIEETLRHLSKIFVGSPGVRFTRPRPGRLKHLIDRLSVARPPIEVMLSKKGMPRNANVPANHLLYAGWAYWFGRSILQKEFAKRIPNTRELTFLECNRLCDYAMLQQCSIEIANDTLHGRRRKQKR